MPRKFCALFAFACTALYGGPLDNWHTRTNLGDCAISGVAYHDGTYVLTGLAPAQIITLTNPLYARPAPYNCDVAFDVILQDTDCQNILPPPYEDVIVSSAPCSKNRVTYWSAPAGNYRVVSKAIGKEVTR